jgi:hypothetical protein
MLYPTELRTELGNGINRIMQTKKGQKLKSLLTLDVFWSEYKDSNLGPPGPKPGALPGCATLRHAVIVLQNLATSEALRLKSSTICQETPSEPSSQSPILVNPTAQP